MFKQLLSSFSIQVRKPFFGLSPFALLVIFFAFVKIAAHMLTAQNGGYYCDELYAIDLSKHLAWGYVDLPPLVPALIALTRTLLGESLLAIHLMPALAGAATLVFICLITRELGGKLFATAVTALSCLMCQFWLCASTYFGYDSFDQLMLAMFLFLLVRFIKTGNKKLWLGLGFTAGIAFLTKATILYYGPGFLVALLISKYRKHLLTAWPWLGLGFFLVVASPFIAWEIANHWPTLEFWGNYHSHLYQATPVEYFIAIFVSFNPIAFPVIAAGLYRIFRRFGETSFFFLGVLFLITTVFLFSLHARYHLLFALFGPLIAAGSVFFEEALSKINWRRWIQTAALAIMAAAAVVAAPIALPLLPGEQMREYDKVFGSLYQAVKFDSGPPPELPLIYGFRNGWDSLARTTADVYHRLSAEDQAKCGGVLTDWFGPAGAIDFYGQKYGIPRAVSGHNNYYIWGPGDSSWEVMIAITWYRQRLDTFFADVQQVGKNYVEFGGPWMNDIPIYICRRPNMPVKNIWPYFKTYM